MRTPLRVMAAGAVLAALAVLPIAPAGSAGSASVSPAPGPGPCARPDAYRVPVPGAVTRLFDPPDVRWAAGHRGVDLAADVGDPVRSPAAGVVSFAGTVVGRGVVTVEHPDGLRSSLEPVDPAVNRGDAVAPGTVLGTLQARSGHDGVHWGVRDGTRYVDPLMLLGCSEPVVLLP